MNHTDHHTQRIESVACAVLTISDTRTRDSDKSGSLIRDLLQARGHKVCAYEILPDEATAVRTRVTALAEEPDCRAILLSGGTGLAKRDTTYEAIAGMMEKTLHGFGELFRMLSYQEIGASAMLSRAIAGTHHSTLIVSMPGSPAAVRLAMERLILPQLGHLAALLAK